MSPCCSMVMLTWGLGGSKFRDSPGLPSPGDSPGDRGERGDLLGRGDLSGLGELSASGEVSGLGERSGRGDLAGDRSGSGEPSGSGDRSGRADLGTGEPSTTGLPPAHALHHRTVPLRHVAETLVHLRRILVTWSQKGRHCRSILGSLVILHCPAACVMLRLMSCWCVRRIHPTHPSPATCVSLWSRIPCRPKQVGRHAHAGCRHGCTDRVFMSCFVVSRAKEQSLTARAAAASRQTCSLSSPCAPYVGTALSCALLPYTLRSCIRYGSKSGVCSSYVYQTHNLVLQPSQPGEGPEGCACTVRWRWTMLLTKARPSWLGKSVAFTSRIRTHRLSGMFLLEASAVWLHAQLCGVKSQVNPMCWADTIHWI